jgi:hypothetical protein
MEKPIMVLEGALPGLGRLNALVKNLMRQIGTDDPNEAIKCINSGEWVLTRRASRWREENGVIYFTVTSDGTSGEDWITRLEAKGYKVSDYAKSVLRSSDFVPTNGITTEIVVLKGELFEEETRVAKNIREEAQRRGLASPNPEVACLIRELFMNKELEEMGLWAVVAMHEPIVDSSGPSLLGVDRDDDGGWLYAYCDEPDRRWNRDYGFAFVVARVSA